MGTILVPPLSFASLPDDGLLGPAPVQQNSNDSGTNKLDRFIASHNAGCSTYTKTYETFYIEKKSRSKTQCKRYLVEEIFKRCRGQDFPLQVLERNDYVPLKNCANSQ